MKSRPKVDGMSQNILLVCTGNTCRSPMAEGLARRILSDITMKKRGSESTWKVESAGVACFGASPPTTEAVRALQKYGIDISNHRSRALTKDMVDKASVIYAMAQHHVDAILEFEPGADQKTQLLDPDGNDIADPIGMGQDFYDKTAKMLEKLLKMRLNELMGVKPAKGAS